MISREMLQHRLEMIRFGIRPARHTVPDIIEYRCGQ